MAKTTIRFSLFTKAVSLLLHTVFILIWHMFQIICEECGRVSEREVRTVSLVYLNPPYYNARIVVIDMSMKETVPLAGIPQFESHDIILPCGQ